MQWEIQQWISLDTLALYAVRDSTMDFFVLFCKHLETVSKFPQIKTDGTNTKEKTPKFTWSKNISSEMNIWTVNRYSISNAYLQICLMFQIKFSIPILPANCFVSIIISRFPNDQICLNFFLH